MNENKTIYKKIIMDTYDWPTCVGVGYFSSNNPFKVDYSAEYYAKFIALEYIK